MSTSFEQALANCSREPIHIPGAIQPFGVLVALCDEQLRVSWCSLNATEAFERPPEAVLGERLDELLQFDGLARIRADDFTAEPSRIVTGDGGSRRTWDAFLHRHRGQLILELERAPSEPQTPGSAAALRAGVAAIEAADSVAEACQCACEIIRAITGLDGVMAYKFHEDEHGEVIAESKAAEFPHYLGLHYPATDIPQQARAIFLDNWVRMIPDRNYSPIPLLSAGADVPPLDLGRAFLRSVSPVHIEYLRNMGVCASLTLSLISKGKLWGLIAGHHYHAPKHLPFERRAACETLARFLSASLVGKMSRESQSTRARSIEAHGELVESMREHAEIADGLVRGATTVKDLIAADGAAVAVGGHWITVGNTPNAAAIARLARWLSEHDPSGEVFSTDHLPALHPEASEFADCASGLLAVRIPKGEHNYVFWFKPEAVRTVRWAGNPTKPVAYEGDGPVLRPRKSFDEWRESVRGRSMPWAAWEIDAAIELNHAIAAIDLQRQFELEQQARAKAEWADQQKEQLLAMVSHDLRDPMHSLMLNIALIQRTLPPDSADKSAIVLASMRRSLQRMNHLISDLLSISKFESGTFTPDFGAHRANELLDDVLQMLQPIAVDKGVRIDIKSAVTGTTKVRCDRDRVLQVLSNLVGNAVKFTPEGGVVELRTEPGDRDVCFVVTDTGPGISKENLEFVFDRFWQARQTQRLGTGLGLTIAKEIVLAHGGRIWVESELGQGSSFRFTIPLHIDASA